MLVCCVTANICTRKLYGKQVASFLQGYFILPDKPNHTISIFKVKRLLSPAL